jgi:hypothetical protein
MIDKLNQLSANQNQGGEEQQNTSADPRWEALKNIKNK